MGVGQVEEREEACKGRELSAAPDMQHKNGGRARRAWNGWRSDVVAGPPINGQPQHHPHGSTCCTLIQRERG